MGVRIIAGISRVLPVAALFLGFVSAVSALEDTPDSRRRLAEEYLQVMPMQEMLEGMSRQFTQGLPEEKAAEARDKMLRGLDVRALEAASVQAMVKTFTAGEIEAMVKYYSSPEGRSAMQKMPAYMQELGPLIGRQLLKRQASAIDEAAH